MGKERYCIYNGKLNDNQALSYSAVELDLKVLHFKLPCLDFQKNKSEITE